MGFIRMWPTTRVCETIKDSELATGHLENQASL